MNLCIDCGNTYIKLHYFENNVLKKTTHCTIDNLHKNLIFRSKVRNIIIVTVHINLKVLEKKIRSIYCNSLILTFNDSIKIPIANHYKTPDTLGRDRLAAVIGANYLFPNKNVLVIDIGTCIKYDMIDKSKNYYGGSITPGIYMRYRSFHDHTHSLPLITKPIYHTIGTDTLSSLHSGVMQAITHEMNGFISQYKKKYKNLYIILTGGDKDYFINKLNYKIIANSQIIAIGLHILLLQNINGQQNK